MCFCVCLYRCKQVTTRTAEDVASPGSGVVVGCRLPNMDARNQTLVLCQCSKDLARKISLQLRKRPFLCLHLLLVEERNKRHLRLMLQVRSKHFQRCLHR